MSKSNDKIVINRHQTVDRHSERVIHFARTIKCFAGNGITAQSRLHDSSYRQIDPQSSAKHKMSPIIHLGIGEKYFRSEIDSISGAYGRNCCSPEGCQAFVSFDEEKYGIGVAKGTKHLYNQRMNSI